METKILKAASVIAKELIDTPKEIEGSKVKATEYFLKGSGGNCGFIVEGDIEKFANYFVLSSGGQCGKITDSVAGGACGFTIQGDYQLAWSNKFFENATEPGNCGFTINL